jgi:hypothetical protein
VLPLADMRVLDMALPGSFHNKHPAGSTVSTHYFSMFAVPAQWPASRHANCGLGCLKLKTDSNDRSRQMPQATNCGNVSRLLHMHVLLRNQRLANDCQRANIMAGTNSLKMVDRPLS